MGRSGFFASVYTKIAFAAVMAALALVAGMYVGTRFIAHAAPSAPQGPYDDSKIPKMILVPGDLFPLESYTDMSGQKGDFELLLKDREAVVLFVTLECGPCLDLVKFLGTRMHDRLRDGVKVIVAVPSSAKEIPPEYVGMFRSFTVVRYDEERWSQSYHLRFHPIVVGVDGSGFITHLQYGFSDAVDRELVERFFKSS